MESPVLEFDSHRSTWLKLYVAQDYKLRACVLSRELYIKNKDVLNAHKNCSRMRRHGLVLLPNIFFILYVLISLH